LKQNDKCCYFAFADCNKTQKKPRRARYV